MYLQEETTLNGVESSISSGPQLKERYRCFSVLDKKKIPSFSPIQKFAKVNFV